MNIDQLSSTLKEKLSAIRLVALDVDGVLTDGKLYFDSNGHEYKSFDVQDGLGIKRLQELGIAVAIITGRKSSIVTRRAEELGIEHVIQDCSDKGAVLSDLTEQLGMSPEQTLFMGDDVPDLAAMNVAGCSVAPRNAVKDVLKSADIELERSGGKGAVRELCDLLWALTNTR